MNGECTHISRDMAMKSFSTSFTFNFSVWLLVIIRSSRMCGCMRRDSITCVLAFVEDGKAGWAPESKPRLVYNGHGASLELHLTSSLVGAVNSRRQP